MQTTTTRQIGIIRKGDFVDYVPFLLEKVEIIVIKTTIIMLAMFQGKGVLPFNHLLDNSTHNDSIITMMMQIGLIMGRDDLPLAVE